MVSTFLSARRRRFAALHSVASLREKLPEFQNLNSQFWQFLKFWQSGGHVQRKPVQAING
jgi:hypothetical protein